MAYTYGQQIWDALMEQINNEIGVAAIMGNLAVESGLIPFRVQNDNTAPYTFSQQYTADVDSGVISEDEFVNNIPAPGYEKGYGLAQWTYPTRKLGLYQMAHRRGVSIGDVNLAIEFLLYELAGTDNLLNDMKNATDLNRATSKFMIVFENPYDQSEAAQAVRWRYAQEIMDEYGHGYHKRKGMPLWMYLRPQHRY